MHITLQWKLTQHSEASIRSDQSLSRVQLFATPWIAACQASLSSPNPGVHSDSRPFSQWCHPAISSSVVPFSSCPHSLSASESFLMSKLFAWGGQSIGVSASASVLPMDIQSFHSKEMISFMMDWLDLLAVQGTLKSLLQHHSSKASILHRSAFFTSGPITLWEMDGETVETVPDFILLAPKSLQMVTAAMKLKDTYSLEGKLWPT